MNRIFFSIVICIGCYLTSCHENSEPEPELRFVVSPNVKIIEFSADGNTALFNGSPFAPTFFVHVTKGYRWEVASNQSWLRVNKTDSAFTLVATENLNSDTPPEAKVTVSAGKAPPVVITVKQSKNMRTVIDLLRFVKSDVGKFIAYSNWDFVYSNITFTNGEDIQITGISESLIAEAYNRDFFDFDRTTGKLKFNGESGDYDVFYSAKYNYFLVMQLHTGYPACYWMIGNGFSTCASRWRSDFEVYGWDCADIFHFAYMKPLGNQKYQTTILTGKGEEDTSAAKWTHFKVNFIGNESWNPFMTGFKAITGDGSFTDKLDIAAPWDVTSEAEGRFRVTLDVANATVNFTKVE